MSEAPALDGGAYALHLLVGGGGAGRNSADAEGYGKASGTLHGAATGPAGADWVRRTFP
ncbi:hypothetical protein ACFYPB_30490 [Streptomyces olivaceoviridis]|uniref:hypothetical protein n=1 Tax=Streptomyces olivaceoviridis TaxID=1921 RepID=UPI0036D16227